jgi:N4-gp56 family major capsid protein
MSQTWNSIEGSIYGNAELSRQSRLIALKKTKLLDAVDPAGEFRLGRKSGDKVGFRLVGRLANTAHTALAESDTVPFDKPPIYHGTGQVFRYAQAIPWTGTRDDLDRLDVKETNIATLRDHAARTINKIIYDVLVAGRSFTYVATGTDASPTHAWLDDGTVSASAASNYSLFHARKIKLRANQNNIPPADGDNYFFYGSPRIEDGIFNDTGGNGWVDVAKYDPARVQGVLEGEIGKFSKLRHVIDNDVIADNIGGSNDLGSGFILGEEAVKEIMVYPVHFRVNMNVGGDFGNLQAIAWQAMLGYKVVWNYTSHGQGSVIHYTSA